MRFGDDSGIETLILVSSFSGLRDEYAEICEEFRLFHKLYYDPKNNQYLKFDKAGNEEIIAIVDSNRIQIRLKEIKQFLAIKEMNLSTLYHGRIYSKEKLEDLGLEESSITNICENLINLELSYQDFNGIDGINSISYLEGKRLVQPFPKEKSGFWGFAEEKPKEYSDFIIGVSEDGDSILQKADPKKLAYFPDKEDIKCPNYITPVFFRLEVLDKYYDKSSKYKIGDGYLCCGYLWSLRIDNHHDNCVVAFLGDLGRDLPSEEQIHWKSYNIQPCGKLSETIFQRAFLAEGVESDRPEHIFFQRYHRLFDSSTDILGWPILLPLEKGDEHYLKSIRIPSTDELKDFDELVLSLAKVLIDSLYEKKLNMFIPEEERGSIKGSIARLERAFVEKGVEDYEDHIRFLRDLQELRSAGSAHRKGSNYEKIAEKFDIPNQSLRIVFIGILEKGIEVLQFLDLVVQSGCFLPEEESKEKTK
ncbi:hypothetical protein J2128_000081 [Methanomicrobium sp. W14]|uniref:hypothetical protein n=1 Tax=Methanomicrobium sp. W14 TaxID=2817839 RepID=UPI001AEAA04D|nr:hypothetical protein [Methanomicrobium sp. W14]MBP2132160.1 hypothetical protein [Methanomicrobium sp. W14]